MNPEQVEVAESHARDQLTEHRGLPKSGCQLSAQASGDEQYREPQDQRSYRIFMTSAGRPSLIAAAQNQHDGGKYRKPLAMRTRTST